VGIGAILLIPGIVMFLKFGLDSYTKGGIIAFKAVLFVGYVILAILMVCFRNNHNSSKKRLL
jgi:uncharacterized membrane protein SirB2